MTNELTRCRRRLVDGQMTHTRACTERTARCDLVSRDLGNLTIDDVELVTLGDLIIGDTIIDFTPLNKDTVIPPTARQLKKPVRGFRTVESITEEHRPVGCVLRFASDWVGMSHAKIWRVKR